MSNGAGETAKDPSAWTPDLVIALMKEADRRYEERFDYLEQLLTERWQAHQAVHHHEEATRKESAAKMDVRLQGLNDLRSDVVADRGQFISREAYEARNTQIDDRLNIRKEQFDGRIALLHDQMTEWRGQSKGLNKTAQIVVGGAGFVATILAIWFALS